ncbi:MAG: hypothetical protein ACON5D_00235 [Rubripirellula sp.]
MMTSLRNEKRVTWHLPLMGLLCFFICGGSTCSRQPPASLFPPPPPVFQAMPGLNELTQVMNRTQSITQLSTNSASVEVLSMPDLPRLNATLNLQREKNFRLRASLPIVFAGIDMGSNSESFWFEVPEGVSKTLYYARYDQYERQLSRAILPVDPTWMMDALGLVSLDPSAVVAGPITRTDGRLEIRTTQRKADGIYERVCILDPQAGYVTDQFLYSPTGALIARSHAENHGYYSEYQCSIPHRVEIHLTPAAGPPLSMKIEVGSYAVNQLLSGDPNLFTMPASAPQKVDLTTLSGSLERQNVSSAFQQPAEYSAGLGNLQPLRGLRY